MTTKAPRNFSGDTPADVKLWHTYLYWARELVLVPGMSQAVPGPAIIDDAANRIAAQDARGLQAIVFSAFVLEYRLKRALIAMNACAAQKTAGMNLKQLLDSFWKRMEQMPRRNGVGRCKRPSEWNVLDRSLRNLAYLRDQIAHANYQQTLSFMAVANPNRQAIEFYNAVVDAIRLVNQGTGYEIRPEEESINYFNPLKVMSVF